MATAQSESLEPPIAEPIQSDDSADLVRTECKPRPRRSAKDKQSLKEDLPARSRVTGTTKHAIQLGSDEATMVLGLLSHAGPVVHLAGLVNSPRSSGHVARAVQKVASAMRVLTAPMQALSEWCARHVANDTDEIETDNEEEGKSAKDNMATHKTTSKATSPMLLDQSTEDAVWQAGRSALRSLLTSVKWTFLLDHGFATRAAADEAEPADGKIPAPRTQDKKAKSSTARQNCSSTTTARRKERRVGRRGWVQKLNTRYQAKVPGAVKWASIAQWYPHAHPNESVFVDLDKPKAWMVFLLPLFCQDKLRRLLEDDPVEDCETFHQKELSGKIPVGVRPPAAS